MPSKNDGKKYYWLKLKEDFFEDDTISWIEEQEHGKDYLVFYLKLCLKFMNKNGVFIREVGNKIMPYDIKRLAQITSTSIDTAMVAMKIFIETGLVVEGDDGVMGMPNLTGMIGSETGQTRRKNENKILKGGKNYHQLTTKIPTEIDIDIEKEVEIDKEIEIPPISPKEMVANFTEDDELRGLLEEFIEMRKQRKKPLTQRSMTMALNKLSELAGGTIGHEDIKKQIVEQSLYHCWDSFYEIKQQKGNNYQPQHKSMDEQCRELEERLARKGFVVDND